MERTKQLHVYIKPELHRILKMEAANQGRSITDLLEEILEKEIEKLSKRYVLHKNVSSRKAYFF